MEREGEREIGRERNTEGGRGMERDERAREREGERVEIRRDRGREIKGEE
jgi:hypothetical protein